MLIFLLNSYYSCIEGAQARGGGRGPSGERIHHSGRGCVLCPGCAGRAWRSDRNPSIVGPARRFGSPRCRLAFTPMRVLLTNDDGIEAAGLQALRRALLRVPSVRAGRDRPRRQPLGDGALDHHPAAAVGAGGRLRGRDRRLRHRRDAGGLRRLANLGLVEGFEAELVVSGINHGSNLGDDITYSGTVAAALEAIVLGLPGHRRLAAVEFARARLPGRVGVRLRGGGRRSPRGWWPSSRMCRCRRARC